MVMDTRIRQLAGRIASEVKGKASTSALAATDSTLAATNAALAATDAALLRTADSDGANLIKNSAWKDLNPNNGLPAGWARAGAQTAAYIVQIAPLAGNTWRFDGVGTQVGAYSPYFDVYPGEQYTYSALVRGAPVGTTTFAMRIEFRDRSNNVLTTFAESFPFPGSATNATVSTTVTVPDTAVRARAFVLHGAAATSGTWFLGNLEFRRLPNEQILKSTYVVHRVKSGGSYPARIPGAVNLFIGDTDPGLAMAADDVWANPDNATYAGVAAAMLDTGSDIRKAMQSESIYIPVTAMAPETTSISETIIGSSPNQRYARVMPTPGVSRMFGSVKLPNTWNSVRIKPHFQHSQSSATAGNIGWLLNLTTTPFNAGSSTGTFYLPNSGLNIVGNGQSGPLAIPVGLAWSFMLARNASATGDTFAYPVQLLGVEFIKES